MKYAGVPVFSRAFSKWIFCFFKAKVLSLKLRNSKSLNEVIDCHFKNWSESEHRTRSGLEIALNSSTTLRLILETGTSAWGCDSSRLFDSVVKLTGGTFYSIDIRPEASQWLKHQTSGDTYFFIDDSINFLRNTLPRVLQGKKIDLIHLDSYDLDILNPEPSERHHLEEFLYALTYLQIGSIVVIDDTPATLNEYKDNLRTSALNYQRKTGRLPGKGSMILEMIKNNPSYQVIWHSENLVFKVVKGDFLETSMLK